MTGKQNPTVLPAFVQLFFFKVAENNPPTFPRCLLKAAQWLHLPQQMSFKIFRIKVWSGLVHLGDTAA